MINPRKPHPVDVHVGRRIRIRRTMLGLSQEKLGRALGLTFQQVQKYERASNRVSAGRLADLSRILDVPVSYFFDDQPGAGERMDPVPARQTLELARLLEAIPRQRKQAVIHLIRAFTREATPDAEDTGPVSRAGRNSHHLRGRGSPDRAGEARSAV